MSGNSMTITRNVCNYSPVQPPQVYFILLSQSIIFITHKPYTMVQARQTYTITNTTWI
jgi:hypothetical protein